MDLLVYLTWRETEINRSRRSLEIGKKKEFCQRWCIPSYMYKIYNLAYYMYYTYTACIPELLNSIKKVSIYTFIYIYLNIIYSESNIVIFSISVFNIKMHM
jgi:hypothetical protein